MSETPLKDIRSEAAQQQQSIRELLHDNYHKRESLVQDLIDFQNEAIKTKRHLYIGNTKKEVKVNEEEDDLDEERFESDLKKASGNISVTITNMTQSLQRIHHLRDTFHQAVGQAEKGFVMKGKLKAIKMDLEETTVALSTAKQETELMREMVKEREQTLVKKLRKQENIRKRIDSHIDQVNMLYRRQDDTLRHLIQLARYKNLSVADFEKMYKRCSQAYLSTLANSLSSSMSKDEKKRVTYTLDKLHERQLKDNFRVYTNKYNRKDQELKELMMNDERKGIQHYKRVNHYIDEQLGQRVTLDRRRYYKKTIKTTRKKTPPTSRNEKTVSTGMTQATVATIANQVKKKKEEKQKKMVTRRRAISTLGYRRRIHMPVAIPKRPQSVSLQIAQRRAKLMQHDKSSSQLVHQALMNTKRSVAALKSDTHRDEKLMHERAQYLTKLMNQLDHKLQKQLEEAAITTNNMPVPQRLQTREKLLNEKLDKIEKAIREDQSVQMTEAAQHELIEEWQHVYYEKQTLQLKPGDTLHFKKINMVVVDIEGATRLYHQDPITTTLALEMVNNLVYDLLKKYGGGNVMANRQSVYMIAFETAVTAVQFATQLQLKLQSLSWPAKLLALHEAREEYYRGTLIFRGLRAKIGIHVGVPVSDGKFYFGPVVAMSAALMQLCPPGEVVLSGLTWRAVRQFDLTTHYDCPIYSKYLGAKHLTVSNTLIIDTLRSILPRSLIRRSYYNHQIAGLSFGDIHDMQANINGMLELVHPLLSKKDTSVEKHALTVSILKDAHAQIGNFLHRYGHTTRDTLSLNKNKLRYLNTKVAHIRVANTKFKRSWQVHSKEIHKTLDQSLHALQRWQVVMTKESTTLQTTQDDMLKREKKIQEKEADVQAFMQEKNRLKNMEKKLENTKKNLAHQQEMVRKANNQLALREKDVSEKFEEMQRTLTIIEETQHANAEERERLDNREDVLTNNELVYQQNQDRLMAKMNTLKLKRYEQADPHYHYQYIQMGMQTESQEKPKNLIDNWSEIEKVVKVVATTAGMKHFLMDDMDGVFKKLVVRVMDQLSIPTMDEMQEGYQKNLLANESSLAEMINNKVQLKLKKSNTKKTTRRVKKTKKKAKHDTPRTARSMAVDEESTIQEELTPLRDEDEPFQEETIKKKKTPRLKLAKKQATIVEQPVEIQIETSQDYSEDDEEDEDQLEQVQEEEEVSLLKVAPSEEEEDDDLVSELAEEQLPSHPATPVPRQARHRRSKSVKKKPAERDSKEFAINKIEKRNRKLLKKKDSKGLRSIQEQLRIMGDIEEEESPVESNLSALMKKTTSALKVQDDLSNLSESLSARSALSTHSALSTAFSESPVNDELAPHLRQPMPKRVPKKKVQVKEMATQTPIMPKAKRALLNKNLYVLSEQYPELDVPELEDKWKTLRRSTSRVEMEYYNRLRKRADQLPIDFKAESDFSKVDDNAFLQNVLQYTSTKQLPTLEISSTHEEGMDTSSDESIAVVKKQIKSSPTKRKEHAVEDSESNDSTLMTSSSQQDEEDASTINESESPSENQHHQKLMHKMASVSLLSPKKRSRHARTTSDTVSSRQMEESQSSSSQLHKGNFSTLPLQTKSTTTQNRSVEVGVTSLASPVESAKTIPLVSPNSFEPPTPNSVQMEITNSFASPSSVVGGNGQPPPPIKKKQKPKGKIASSGRLKTYLKPSQDNASIALTSYKDYKRVDVRVDEIITTEHATPIEYTDDPTSGIPGYGVPEKSKEPQHEEAVPSHAAKPITKVVTSSTKVKKPKANNNMTVVQKMAMELQKRKRAMDNMKQQLEKREATILKAEKELQQRRDHLSQYLRYELPGTKPSQKTASMDKYLFPRFLVTNEANVDNRPSPVAKPIHASMTSSPDLMTSPTIDTPSPLPAIKSPTNFDKDGHLRHHFRASSPVVKEEHPEVLMHRLKNIQSDRVDATKIIDAQEWIANMPLADFKHFFQTLIPQPVATSMVFGPSSLNTKFMSELPF